MGKGSGSPYKYPETTAEYIAKWIHGAKTHYNLTIDYIGQWNERPYNLDYILTLRRHLDKQGLQHVRMIAPDGKLAKYFAKDILNNKTIQDAIYAIGDHYPGTVSTG